MAEPSLTLRECSDYKSAHHRSHRAVAMEIVRMQMSSI